MSLSQRGRVNDCDKLRQACGKQLHSRRLDVCLRLNWIPALHVEIWYHAPSVITCPHAFVPHSVLSVQILSLIHPCIPVRGGDNGTGRYLIHIWWNNKEMNPMYYFLLRVTFLQEMRLSWDVCRKLCSILSLIWRTTSVYSGGTILQRLGAAQRGEAQSKTKIWIPLRSPQRTCKDGWVVLSLDAQHTGNNQHFHMVHHATLLSVNSM